MANPMMQRYNNQTGSSGGRRFDVKAEVKGYNLSEGTMDVRLSDNSAPVREGYPQDITVQISKQTAKKYPSNVEFEGNMIDKRLKENVLEGDTVVLQSLDIKANQNTSANVRWIKQAPGANPDKLLEGTFTVSGIAKSNEENERSYEIVRFQQWSQRGMTPDEFFTDQMKANFDEAISRRQKAQEADAPRVPVKPNVGVALRAVLDGQVVDYIPPVSYNSEESRPISYDEVKQGYEGYKDHIAETYGDSARVEVVPVRDFPVGEKSREPLYYGSKGERTPTGTMMRTSAPLNEGSTAPGIGNQTLAITGVVALSPGALNPRTGERKGADSDIVTDAYFSSRKEHIHDMIPDANGEKVEVSSVIREKMSYPPRAGMEQTEEATQSQDAEPEPAPSTKADMGGEPDPLDEDDAMLDDAFNAAEQKASGPSMG